MRTRPSVAALCALGAVATMFALNARADDWSIGIALPGVVVVVPAPAYVPAPPEYYGPAYYYPPRYYRPPVGGYYGRGYEDSGRGHHHHDHDDDGGDDNDE